MGRNRIAIFGPLRRTVGGVGMLVYRLKRLKVEKGINTLFPYTTLFRSWEDLYMHLMCRSSQDRKSVV